MTELSGHVAYLENDDFDSKGNPTGELIKKAGNRPIVIMAQATWCPHCTTAKPAFQEYSDTVGNKVLCATIHSDGDKQTEKDLAKRIMQIDPSFQGFPHYMMFKNGKLVDKQIGGRTVEHLKEFSMTK